MLQRVRMFLGTFLLLASAMGSAAVQKTTILQNRLQLPYGDSYWPISFTNNPVLQDLELAYVAAPGCEKVSYRIDYLPSGSSLWFAAVFQNGVYRTNGQAIQALRVWLNQRVRPNLLCDFKLQQVWNDGTTNPGVGSYAGLIEYKGGFALNQTITLPQPVTAQRLDVLIPDYCKNLEVLEVALVQQGKVSKARPVSQEGTSWIVNQATTFDQIQVTLNGPVGQQCQIPVYLKLDPAPVATPQNLEL